MSRRRRKHGSLGGEGRGSWPRNPRTEAGLLEQGAEMKLDSW